jgi:hypothetical protein
LSFDVTADEEEVVSGEARPASSEDVQKQVDGWQAICEEMRRMAAMAIEFSHRSVDRVLEQARQDNERIQPLTELTREMLGHYRDGLRMQAAALKEVSEVRVQQQIAQASANDNGKMWDVLAPAIQIAVVQAQQRLLGGGRPAAKALPVGAAPVARFERKEINRRARRLRGPRARWRRSRIRAGRRSCRTRWWG